MGGDSPKRSSLGGEATPFRGAVVSKPTELLRAGRHRTTISQKTISVCIREWLRPGCNPLQAARAGGWAGKKIEIKSDEKEKRGKEKATRKEEKKKGKTIQIIFLVFKKNKEEKDSGQPIRMRSKRRAALQFVPEPAVSSIRPGFLPLKNRFPPVNALTAPNPLPLPFLPSPLPS